MYLTCWMVRFLEVKFSSQSTPERIFPNILERRQKLAERAHGTQRREGSCPGKERQKGKRSASLCMSGESGTTYLCRVALFGNFRRKGFPWRVAGEKLYVLYGMMHKLRECYPAFGYYILVNIWCRKTVHFPLSFITRESVRSRWKLLPRGNAGWVGMSPLAAPGEHLVPGNRTSKKFQIMKSCVQIRARVLDSFPDIMLVDALAVSFASGSRFSLHWPDHEMLSPSPPRSETMAKNGSNDEMIPEVMESTRFGVIRAMRHSLSLTWKKQKRVESLFTESEMQPEPRMTPLTQRLPLSSAALFAIMAFCSRQAKLPMDEKVKVSN